MEHPIQLVPSVDLERSRLTVFFRLILAIPHLIWLYLFGIAAFVVWVINWFATLFSGTSPDSLHNFTARWVRYQTHVVAYLLLIADPYPGFMGDPGYPIDIEIAPPEPQNRWKTFFRYLLAIPAMIVAGVLQWLGQIIAFLGWFAILFTGRMPEGFQTLNTWVLRFSQQSNGYLFLLTDRYPSFSTDPRA